MEHKKYLSFRGKNEYTLIRERTEKYGLGKLMFAFMDVEWQKRRDELADLKERCYVENIDQEALLNMQDDSKNYIVLGAYYKALYDQAGNSIAVPIFESIFRKIILQEVA